MLTHHDNVVSNSDIDLHEANSDLPIYSSLQSKYWRREERMRRLSGGEQCWPEEDEHRWEEDDMLGVFGMANVHLDAVKRERSLASFGRSKEIYDVKHAIEVLQKSRGVPHCYRPVIDETESLFA